MTDDQRQPATLALLVAHQGSLAVPDVAGFVAGADEVIEICTGHPVLRGGLTPGTRYRHISPRLDGAAHALNLGVSLAESEWVVLSYGDELPARGWLDQVRALLAGSGSRCIHLFHSGSTEQVPIVAARRMAFAYGAFDERVSCDRLAALHWALRIFPSPGYRILPDEGISRHRCNWLRNPDRPLVDGVLGALLDQALSSGAATLSLAALRKGMAAESAPPADPYRSGAAYEAREFWDSNAAGYIRWEIYQPDEPEILALLRKIAPDSVLELGCGAGRNTRYFGGAKRYAGIDVSMNLLRRATEKQQPNSLGTLCGDITALPVADDAFELVFSDSTVQHVTPAKVRQCVAEMARVSSGYICVIEYTEEEREGGDWFEQIHMFAHDYLRLFEPYCELVWRADTSMRVHPARKEVFLFRKRQQG